METSTTTITTATTTTANAKKTRVALFTVRSFAIEHAIPVIEGREDTELALVLTSPGPKNRRSEAHVEVVQTLMRCGYPNIDVVVSNKKSKWPAICQLYDVDMILCSGFPWLLPASLTDNPQAIPLGVINIHNSQLPKYQGPNAFGWQIINQEPAIGYCVHRMDSHFDTGNILFTESVPLDINEDYYDLQLKMPSVYRNMVHKALELCIAKHPGFAQVGEPTHAPKFTPEFRWIDFTKSTAREAHDKVRAYFGMRDHPKGALCKMINGDTICITKTRYHAPLKLVGLPPTVGGNSNGIDDEEESDMASLTNTTVTSMTTATNPAEVVIATKICPGTIVSGDFPSGCGGPNGVVDHSFFVQCSDTTLEVLEWHKHPLSSTMVEEE